MILFKDKKFKGWLDLLYYLVNKEEDFNTNIFPHSSYFYTQAAIKDKLGIFISIKELKQLIKEELALKTITLKEYKEVSQSNASC